jgi:integrase
MLYRLVRSMKRSDSSMRQFVQRIPADLRERTIGLRLVIPLTDTESATIQITPAMEAIRFSLRTRDPSEAKIRQGRACAHLETVWRGLRSIAPTVLTDRQAHALAAELYRAWTPDHPRERTLSATLNLATRQFEIDRPKVATPEDAAERAEEDAQAFATAAFRLDEAAQSDGLEAALGPLVDRLLLSKGIAEIAPECRPLLLNAFRMALQDAFERREREAQGDYTPDPKAARFPEWIPPADTPSAPSTAPKAPPKVTLTGLVEAWWPEAKAADRKQSTYESYRNTAGKLRDFLGHDDAARVTPDDVIRFKDHRLASGVSAKTVKDSDLSALKSLFGWAVTNRKLPSNPAAGLTIKLGKAPKVRSKGFTDAEAQALLSASLRVSIPARFGRQTALAKRWVPWLLAYTGARLGEMAQLRKQDVRREGDLWVLTVTPEAGTVKTNEAREIVLHQHFIDLGFPEFAEGAPPGHLFLRPAKDGTVRGPLRGLKNRLQEFARETVSDRNVAPNHGWRHRFKTVGIEAGIETRILDAIQGQAPASVAATYGHVSLKAQAEAMKRIPLVKLPE